MTGIYGVMNPLADSLGDLFINSKQAIGHLSGRAFKLIQHIPDAMQRNRSVAFTVFFASNAVFLTLANLGANRINSGIEKRAKESGKELNDDQKLFKNIADLFAFGGIAAIFNFGFAKAMQYPLHPVALTALTMTAVAVRFLSLNQEAVIIEDAKAPSDESLETQIDDTAVIERKKSGDKTDSIPGTEEPSPAKPGLEESTS